MSIEAKIINKGYHLKIQIIYVTLGYSQYLKDGVWVNCTEVQERFEEEILTMGKCFETTEEAEKFMKSKAFKSLFKNVEKNWL